MRRIHIDRYDNPKEMWAFIEGGMIVKADEDQITIVKNGRTFEISPDYSSNQILRINEVIE